MKVLERYRRLSIWNRVAFWGSAASMVGLLSLLFTLYDRLHPQVIKHQGEIEETNRATPPPPSVTEELRQDRAVEVVEASFPPTNDEEFPVLEVKLRNKGAVAFLKEARFDIEHVLRFRSINCPRAMPVTWTYDVLLPTSGVPKTVSLPISQVVPSSGVDRFRFRLGNDAPVVDDLVSYVFQIRLTLVYNAAKNELKTPPLAFISGPAQIIEGFTQCRDAIDVYPENKKIYLALREFNGTISNDLRLVLNKYQEALAPKLSKWLEEADDDEGKIRYYVWSLYHIAPVEPSALESLKSFASIDRREFVRLQAASALAAFEHGEVLPKPGSDR